MKAPVWFLISHVDLVGGSSGYHHASVIDQFIRNFFDWWLVGTYDNGSWGWDMWDSVQPVCAGRRIGRADYIRSIRDVDRDLL